MKTKFQFNLWQIGGLGALLLLVGVTIGVRYPNLALARWGDETARPNFNNLDSLYGVLQQKFDGQIDNGKVLDGARAGLVSATGDPYTTYLTAAEAKALSDSLNGSLSGVGIEVGIKNNRLTVIAPVSGTPADRAGIKAGDIIAAINGEDTSSMTLDQAVSKIRGTKGTQVKLTIIRGSSKPNELTLTRDLITVPSVESQIKPGNIGYVKISQFDSDTANLFDGVAKQFQQAGVKKVVIDLRNDPGGYLDRATSVASHFLPKGQVIVQERRDNGQTVVDTLKSTGGELEDVKLEILINSGSASASEIVAGALQDHKRAEILGETSFGKGSVQEIESLPGGAQLKVTVAHWYTPNGRNITKEGIKPDVAVKLLTADSDAGRDPQLDAALAKLR